MEGETAKLVRMTISCGQAPSLSTDISEIRCSISDVISNGGLYILSDQLKEKFFLHNLRLVLVINLLLVVTGDLQRLRYPLHHY